MFSTFMTRAKDFHAEWFVKWRDRLKLPSAYIRKSWEIAVVAETLESHGALTPNKCGVGFGVGSEELTGQLAEFGPTILATDLCDASWSHINGGFHALGRNERVRTRVVDMNWLDGTSGKGVVEVEDYDFSYSICSMDHCGTAWWTKRFLLNQMNCLRVGGISVHTGEYTISLGLPRSGSTIWLDWKDVLDITELFGKLGYEAAPIDWNLGDSIEDHQVDAHPWNGPVHLKPETNGGRWGMCIAFTARKTRPGTFWVPLDEAEARALIDEFQRSHSQT